jgi:hypothetical protein
MWSVGGVETPELSVGGELAWRVLQWERRETGLNPEDAKRRRRSNIRGFCSEHDVRSYQYSIVNTHTACIVSTVPTQLYHTAWS